MTPEHILKKARDLVRLRDRAGNKSESLAAAKALAKLIEKHRIQMAELEEHVPFEDFDFPERPLMQYHRATSWRRHLSNILGQHYGVAVVERRFPDRSCSVCLCGKPSDIAVLRFMFRFLQEEMDRLVNQDARGLRAQTAWREGFVMGIKDQLDEARKEAQQGHPRAAMVLRCRQNQAIEALKTKLGRTPDTVVRNKQVKDLLSFANGYARGREQDMDPAPQLESDQVLKP